jgi:nitrogen regulatory protein PII
MREIKVYLRSAALEPVMRALHDAGVAHIVVNHVQSYGSGVDPKHLRLSMEAGTQYTENAKMHTGAPGDGIIFVSPVERAFKIRTRTEGREALR